MIRIIIGIFITIFCSLTTNAQWDWAIKTTESKRAIISSGYTDFYNNIHVIYDYNDTLQFNDTAFIHNMSGTNDRNKAVVVFNSHGVFLKALDIYTPSGTGDIMKTVLTVDKDRNMYLCLTFY